MGFFGQWLDPSLLSTWQDSILHMFDPFSTRAVQVDDSGRVFATPPLLTPLLFNIEVSDARDHCANERTFLSWLRLSVYMAVVSVAVIISFHLKSRPTSMERRLAFPFGLIFWFLSLACLANGLYNYMRTVRKYSKRRAIVQSGWKTEAVFAIIALSIVAACVLFISTNAAAAR